MSTAQINIQVNNSIAGVMDQAKQKIKEEVKKKVMKVVKEKLPSKEEIMEKLISAACSIAAQEKMKKIYNKLHGVLEMIEGVLNKAKSKLDAIKAKIDGIINKVIPVLQKIFIALGILVILVLIIVYIAPIIFAASTSLASNGAIEETTSKQVKKANNTANLFNGTIKSVKKALKKYLNKALKIIGIIAIEIGMITPLLDLVQKMKAFLEYLYLMYLGMCNNPDDSVMDADGNINEDKLKSEILSKDPTGFGSEILSDSTSGIGGAGLGGVGLNNSNPLGIGGIGPGGVGIGPGNLGTVDGIGMDTVAGQYGLGTEGLGQCIRHRMHDGTIMSGPVHGPNQVCIEWANGTINTGGGNPKNQELYGISEKLTLIYADLLKELEGKGKKEIIEHLRNLDFGFQTRFERKIVPIT